VTTTRPPAGKEGKLAYFGRTKGRKEGAVDGINLFFGALLGANLGTLDGLKLVTYVQLMVVLVGTVMALRMISTSENRGAAFVLLGVYLLALIAMVAMPQFQPAGLPQDDLHRLVATLVVWVAMVVMLELISARKLRREQAAEAPPADE
jgi:uncharacterized membrane protein YoaK (UPF0700 family)